MPGLKKFGRRVARATRGARRFANKRYFYKKSNYKPRIGKIASDISVLKNLINAEKKTFQITNIENCGQVNGNSNGALVELCTPFPDRGSSASQRNGDSIKVVSAIVRMQFQHMTNTSIATNLIIEMWEVMGTPQSAALATSQLWRPNPFITGGDIRDYNALVDQDYRQQYRLVAQRKAKVPAELIAGQRRISQLTIPIKFKKYGHHVKFADGTTTVASGSLMFSIRADAGNMSGGTASTLTGPAITGILTGTTCRYSINYYYYDN